MKKLITLVLALGLVLGTVSMSSATDIRVGGVFDVTMGKVWNAGLAEGTTRDFIARERFRTWIDFIVSESLKGQIFLEIGEANFGNWGDHTGRGQTSGLGQGFSIGGDGVNIEVRRAFFDWVVPNTALQVRVGLQNIALPKSNPGPHYAIDDDMAGVALSYKFNDMVGLNLFWARPYDNDNGGLFGGGGSINGGVNDTMDLFGLIVPITGDGYKVSLFGVYANIGNNVQSYVTNTATPYSGKNMTWVPGGQYDYAWWLGTAMNLNIWDPLRIGFDFLYGDWHSEVNDKTTGTSGWFVDLLVDYKMSWGTPGLIAWYGTGDDDDERGRLPQISSPGNRFLNFGMNDEHMAFGDGKVLSSSGIGTWGVALQIKDLSFVDKMTHLIRIGYVRGTNDKNSTFGRGGTFAPNYMSTKDWAIEVDFLTRYQIYDNLTAFFELAWLRADFAEHGAAKLDDVYDKNGFKVGFGLQYRF